jgi:RimJ/RimL family protein N-acetyltransferase
MVITEMSIIKLKPLDKTDAEIVFQWRNDPFIYNLGTQQKTVEWEEHLKWINDTITNKTRKAFIILIDNIPAGQVRFDRESPGSENCVISVYLIELFTGKGYGIEAIKAGCNEIRKIWSQKLSVFAEVRKDNVNSQKAFVKAGFTLSGKNQHSFIYEFK